MHVIIAIGLISATLSISTFGFLNSPKTQSLVVPNTYTVSFERGDYEIIKSTRTPKTMLSDKELISILKEAGFRGYELRYAWAIVVKESTKRPMALNKSSNCYGLFQINMTGSMGPDRRKKYGLSSNEDLYDPLTNARIAYQMSNGGKNWSAWSTKNTALDIIHTFPN